MPQPKGKNRMERDWGVILKLDSTVARAEFEAIKFRLAEGTYYTPDWWVVRIDGHMEIHETKGHMREAARVRLRACAALYPEFLFVLVTKSNERWITEDMPESEAVRKVREKYVPRKAAESPPRPTASPSAPLRDLVPDSGTGRPASRMPAPPSRAVNGADL